MGLGETLRKAMDKLQGSAQVDKDTVKETIKEIQRALIASNVETKIVLELSAKIEDNAFSEIKGTLSRENILQK